MLRVCPPPRYCSDDTRRADRRPAAQPPRLLDRLRHACRVRHYSLRTEDGYRDWVRRFILFHGKRHPLDMGRPRSTRS